MAKSNPRQSNLWIYLALAATIFLVYSQVVHFDFITFDDPDYVTANPHVQAGLSPAGLAWAFTTSAAGSWQPLTWLSLMLDAQLFGLDGGAFHFTNLWLHVLNSLLWFGLLLRITGARWKSALVAFLFALHPLHVESVAWVTERKDVLSGLFWVLTMWGYSAYVAKPRRGRYLLTLTLFCLGLLAKPILVTLPVVLLLLDYWPLQRGPRILEKLPFAAATIAVSVVTLLVHATGQALVPFEQIPLTMRLENALVSCAFYLVKMVWPADLAFFYPYSLQSVAGLAAMAGTLLGAITGLVIWQVRRRPYLAVGWFWYLVTLLPVIGILQAGAQARADRFTYLPMIGIAIAVVWGSSELLEGWPRVRLAVAGAVCSACLVLTWVQVSYWRDSVTVYRHAIEVTSDNYLARFNLASILETRGESAEAVALLRDTVRTRPYFAAAHAELGQLLARMGEPKDALAELQAAVQIKPDSADSHFRLGSVLGALGRNGEALTEFAEGLRLEPGNADAHYNYGIALVQTGQLQEAAREFAATVVLRPDDVPARFNLGIALTDLGRTGDAKKQFLEILRLKPDFADARQALARLP